MRPLGASGLVLTFLGLFLVFGSTFMYAVDFGGPDGFLRSDVGGIPFFFFLVLSGAASTAIGILLARREFTTIRQQYEKQTIDMIEDEYSRLMGVEGVEEEVISAPPEETKTQPPKSQTGPPTLVKFRIASAGVDEVCVHCAAINPLKSTKCSSCEKEIYVPDETQPSCPVCGAPIYEIPPGGGRVICQICFSELDAIV